jgi:hypothetical protein
MPILSSSDINELSAAWTARREEAFKDQVVLDFLRFMQSRIPADLKERLLDSIAIASKPKHMNCGFGGVQFDVDHSLYADGWGSKRMTIKQLIYSTDALSQLAAMIGEHICVTPRFADAVVYFTIDFFPPRTVQVYNPEDEVYDDLPELDPPV